MRFYNIGVGVASVGSLAYGLIVNPSYRKGTLIFVSSSIVLGGLGYLIDKNFG
jgi:hypothetical protein